MKYLNDYYYQLKNENIDEKERAIKKEISYISYYKNQDFFNYLFDQDFNNIRISTNMYNMAIINEKNELINKNQIQQEIQTTLTMLLGHEIHNLKEENNKFKQMQRITNNSPAFIKTLENLKNEVIEHRTPSPFFPSPFINNEISSQSLFTQEIENLKEENSKLKKENIYLKKQKFRKQKYHIEKLIEDKNKINLKLKQLQSKKVQIL